MANRFLDDSAAPPANAVTPAASPPRNRFLEDSTAAGGAATAVPVSNETWGAYLAGLGRAAAQGVSFGTADEIEAGVRTGGGVIGNYDETLSSVRDGNKQFHEAHPVASTVAEIAGGIALPGAGGVKLAARGAEALGGGIAARAASRATVGGVEGAAYGFGTGEGGFDQRVDHAAMPAAIGAGAGVAAPAVAAVIAPAAGAIRRGADNALARFGNEGAANRVADREVRRAFEQDASIGGRSVADEVATARSKASSGDITGTLADSGGDQVRALASKASSESVGGQRLLRETRDTIDAQRPGDVHYEKGVYKDAPIVSKELDDLLANNPAIADANKLALRELKSLRADAPKAGEYTVQHVDQIDRMLRDRAEVLARRGENSKADTINKAREQLGAVMKDHSPLLVENKRLYRQGSQRLDNLPEPGAVKTPKRPVDEDNPAYSIASHGLNVMTGGLSHTLSAAVRAVIPQSSEKTSRAVAERLFALHGTKGFDKALASLERMPVSRREAYIAAMMKSLPQVGAVEAGSN
jgi:hypothetical protein